MKKTLLITTILVVLLIILTSCQASKNGNVSTNESSSAKMHTVTFSQNDESDSDFSVSVERGMGVQRPQDPERNGYAFEGWYVGDEKWSFITNTVNNDITLYAKWTPIEYQIEYVGAQGKITSYTINDEIVLEDGVVSSSDTFLGWYLDEELTKKVEIIKKGTTGNIKLYAKTEIETPEFVFAPLGGTSNYALIGCKTNQSTVKIPQTYMGHRITKIASYAFYGCENLTHVELQSTLTEISEYAFYGCQKLVSINLKYVTKIGEYAFSKCYALEEIELGNQLVSIGNGAFEYCIGLESVTIPKYVSSIGYGAFPSANSNLKVYTQCQEKPQDWSLDNLVVIWGYSGENGTTESGLEWASTETGVVITGYVGEATELEIPRYISGGKVTGICTGVFKNNSSILTVVIPSTIESIEEGAFNNSSNLKVYCEANEKPQGWHERWNINGRTIVWGYKSRMGTNESGFEWASVANGVLITGYVGIGTSLDIPAQINGSTVIGIAPYAFYFRVTITSVAIPNTIETIGEKAFYNCTSLKSVNMGTSVSSIGANAFYYCVELEEIELGKSVSSIGSYAFAHCKGLKEITILNSVSEIGNQAFGACNYLKIYCEPAERPQGWHERWNGTYNNVYWDYFAPDHIG